MMMAERQRYKKTKEEKDKNIIKKVGTVGEEERK